MTRKILVLASLGVLLWLPRPLNAGDLSQILPGVYRYRDTCNVYAIVRNQKALLIDFGSGEILKSLAAINARQVDWILPTHFHRDQCQGDKLAKAQGIRIAVPAAERKYFETPEQLWQQKKVFDLYDLRNEFFMLRENIAADSALQADTTFEWEGLKIRVVGSPGHTEGSLSYLVTLDGKLLAFCGDLVASPGKILTMHDHAGTLRLPQLSAPGWRSHL